GPRNPGQLCSVSESNVPEASVTAGNAINEVARNERRVKQFRAPRLFPFIVKTPQKIHGSVMNKTYRPYKVYRSYSFIANHEFEMRVYIKVKSQKSNSESPAKRLSVRCHSGARRY